MIKSRLEFITIAVLIHERNLNEEFNDYNFDVKNTSYYIEERRSKAIYVNCYSVIRVEDEDVETFTTSVWFDEYGNITDII